MLNRQTKVPNIRILPMSKRIFNNKSIEDVQREFFTMDLSNGNNREYKYTDSGMKSEQGSISHHLVPMENQDEFDNSLYVRANVISLCPNCHNRIHHSIYDEKVLYLEKLHSKRENRLKSSGINITIEKLNSFYK